ncbi:Proteinaceous RNase P 3 isoform D [Glycine soja]|uniref:Uncharacterized protein n=2 Tax=Glycine subgen. Soja TaxID=1462606 RepID=K7M320_SOYBN|nr:Proteinaceous RNase P 3 isoform D [Glycine soja]
MEEHPKKKKKGCRNPETKFQFELNSCSKAKDLRGAISLYDDAVSNNTRLNQHHFNALLYLCSNSVADPSLKPTALDYGFRAFRHMSALAVLPNEATVTAVARLAAAKGDADYAFELVKSMGKNYNNALPRLRTYDPALFCFCEMLDADKAYEVEEHMNGVGVSLEEAELAALLKAWLEKHASYEAIVDGANIGLYQQNFADGGFNISQLDDVVKELYNRSGKKWPLVVLHNKRLRGLMENPSSRRLVEEWMKNGVLYTTPNGSNDDWYWLFAAVKLRCLLVTNDEMRDHIFELIGSNFFNQWKERHQVHYTFVKGNLKLQMPPSYSLVIQESEKGYWHVPLVSGTSCESTRCWLCITRPSGHDAVATVSNGVSSLDSQVDENSATSIAGKRKERSPPS